MQLLSRSGEAGGFVANVEFTSLGRFTCRNGRTAKHHQCMTLREIREAFASLDFALAFGCCGVEAVDRTC